MILREVRQLLDDEKGANGNNNNNANNNNAAGGDETDNENDNDMNYQISSERNTHRKRAMTQQSKPKKKAKKILMCVMSTWPGGGGQDTLNLVIFKKKKKKKKKKKISEIVAAQPPTGTFANRYARAYAALLHDTSTQQITTDVPLPAWRQDVPTPTAQVLADSPNSNTFFDVWVLELASSVRALWDSGSEINGCSSQVAKHFKEHLVTVAAHDGRLMDTAGDRTPTTQYLQMTFMHAGTGKPIESRAVWVMQHLHNQTGDDMGLEKGVVPVVPALHQPPIINDSETLDSLQGALSFNEIYFNQLSQHSFTQNIGMIENQMKCWMKAKQMNCWMIIKAVKL